MLLFFKKEALPLLLCGACSCLSTTCYGAIYPVFLAANFIAVFELNANIYPHNVYSAEDIRLNHRFVDILERRPDGDIPADDRKFHDTIMGADELNTIKSNT